MITIDGSYAEGGGQILRTSIALASVLQKPVRIENIRAKRPTPGLKPQHLTVIKVAKLMTDAEVKGDKIGSTVVEFNPRTLKQPPKRIDIGTAGSITLLLQAIMPIMIFLPKEVQTEIVGGTDVKWSPSIDYFKYVTLGNLSLMGVKAEVEVVRRGFYPKGHGLVRFSSLPSRLNGFEATTRGKVKSVNVLSFCGSLPASVAERQLRAALSVLDYLRSEMDNFELFGKYGRVESLSKGSVCTCYAKCENSLLGADSLGELGKPAERVGEECAEKLKKSLSSRATFDSHMGDQILLFAALAKTPSVFTVESITNHVKANIYTIQTILEKEVFEVEGNLIKVKPAKV